DDLSAIHERPAHRLNQVQLTALSTLLTQYQKAMPEFLKLASLPYGRFNPPNVSTACEGNRATRFALYDRIESGDVTGAARCLLANWNASRALGDQPFSNSITTRIRLEAGALSGIQRFLAHLEPDDATIATLQKAIEGSEAESLLVVCAR